MKKTRKYFATAAIVFASAMMLAGCGSKQVESEADYPTNAMEERAGKTVFGSYDEIIDSLKEGEAYALVDIKGYDGQVLLITDYTYDNLDGNMAAIEATPYTVKSDGRVTADSMFVAGGTANPIAIDNDGVVYLGTHTTMTKECYGTNGTDDVGVMILADVYIDEFDDNGDPSKVGGFIRTENTVVDNDGEDIASDNVAVFGDMYEEYAKANIVNFTVVK